MRRQVMRPLATRPLATSLAAISSTLPARGGELVGTSGVAQIARDQAAAKRTRGDLKRSARKAVAALVKSSQASLVLGHIHPRWLREAVERELDTGVDVTEASIAELRRAGPCAR